jgi:hypothetical protein
VGIFSEQVWGDSDERHHYAGQARMRKQSSRLHQVRTRPGVKVTLNQLEAERDQRPRDSPSS